MFEIIALVMGSIIGIVGSEAVIKRAKVFDLEKKRNDAEKTLEKSKNEAIEILTDAKSQLQSSQKAFHEDCERREARLKKTEENLRAKEEVLQKREARNKELKLRLASEEEAYQGLQHSIERQDKEFLEKLAIKTGHTTSTLKEDLLNKYDKELKADNERRLQYIEEQIKENAPRQADKVVLTVLQRLITPTSTENRAVYVRVPKDSIKGKIVGKDGQNIQYFEQICEVDVVFNEFPNTISISCYHLVRRRIAQKTMENLVRHRGDISKKTIDSAYKAAEKDMDKELYEIGKKAIDKLNIKEKDPELTRIIGRLKYRTSYGQNILMHSTEVAWVAMMMAYETGLDVEVLRTAAFLHDLGKAIDQDPGVEGTHDYLSKVLMEKYGYSWEEVHAAWVHHDAEPQQTPEAIIVKAADAVSASRPGARRESLEKYIERLQALEATAKSFEGVKNSYAISAGRELRIFVDPKKVSDQGSQKLAENVAQTVEDNISYPGTVKVNVVRRTNSIEVAK